MAANHQNEKHKKERLGLNKHNTQGIKMTIVEYYDSNNIIVEFEDGVRKKTKYNQFSSGSVQHPGYKKPRTMTLKEQRMSETVMNKEGYKMHIVEYNKAKDVVVEFEDEYHARVHTDYRFFKQGEVRNPNKIGLYGERLGNESPTMENGKELKVYGAWRGIFSRITCTEGYYHRFYNDVSISKDWLYYTNFYNWATNQENYDRWKINDGGMWSLDKDILSDPNNKIYSADTCCLVPWYINSLVVRQRQKDRQSDLPLGIQCYPYGDTKYYYADNTGEKRKNIYFNTIEDAVKGYKEFRKRCIEQTAEYAYKKGDITQRCYEGLLKYDLFAYEK